MSHVREVVERGVKEEVAQRAEKRGQFLERGRPTTTEAWALGEL